jgi:hypothetical protein
MSRSRRQPNKNIVITGFITSLKLKDQYLYHRTPRISNFRYNQPLEAGATQEYDLSIAKGMGTPIPTARTIR